MKRYELYTNDDDADMIENPYYGKWVKYEDVIKIINKYKNLIAYLETKSEHGQGWKMPEFSFQKHEIN